MTDIDGGNKVEIATGGHLDTGSWAPDSFHLLLMRTQPAVRPKTTSSGLMAAVFVSSHGR